VVEIKAVEALAPVHEAQLITYLKLTGCPVGLSMNFNVPVLKNGIRRKVHPKHASVSRLNKLSPLPPCLRSSVCALLRYLRYLRQLHALRLLR
jgi:hypothetical protein